MFCISISHKKASAHIRETYALSLEERQEFRNLLKEEETINASIILCTCNRSEIYFTKEKVENEQNLIDRVIHLFAWFRSIDPSELNQYLNVYVHEAAVNHIFQVCAGLESKILGEDEILRQVKEAIEESSTEDKMDYTLNVVFQKAIACAKKIKTDTKLSNVPISITTLVANEVFHIKKPEKVVLMLGITGKIGSVIAKNLLAKSNIRIIAAIRTHKNPIGLFPLSTTIEYVPYENRYDFIEEADVIISATSSPHFMLCGKDVQSAIFTNKKRLFLDLAMPRDIDPFIGELEGVTLYNIDHFDNISEENSLHKLEELECAKIIMEEEKEAALKEIAFHDNYEKIPMWKSTFQEVPLEKILYQMKKTLDLQSLKTVMAAFDQISDCTQHQ